MCLLSKLQFVGLNQTIINSGVIYEIILLNLRHYEESNLKAAIIGDDISDEDRYEWLRGYVRTYLERDIRDLADFRNLNPFVLTQRMTALYTGQTINYSTLAKEAGITAATAKKFLSYLEISYQIPLAPFRSNGHSTQN